MTSRRAPRSALAPGFEISRVLTGLWQIADMERDGRAFDRRAAVAAIAPYAEAGLTTFDMADHYGSAEEIVGEFQAARGGLEVATKWVPRPGPLTRAAVRRAVETALERLRSDSVDLLQFHAWSYSDPRYLDALYWLAELRDDGLIGHLGLTNFDSVHLEMVLKSGIEVVSNQVSFSLLDRRAAGRMSAVCAAHGVKLLAYGTLAGGLLSERFLGQPDRAPDALATWSQMKYRRFLEQAGSWRQLQQLLEVLHAVARRHDASIANVASRMVLDEPAVAGVIVGARLGESEHIDDTLRLFDLKLDDEDRAAIDATLADLDPIPGDCGDEYRRPPFLTASGDLSHHLDEVAPPFEADDVARGRRRVSSGTPWEEIAGYSRAVRDGSRVLVSGTTATHGDRLIGGDDPAAQALFVIDKIEGSLQSLGASLADVVRTRVFVSRAEHWEPVARVHGERFAEVRPANTLVEARLIGDEYLVEMEAEAVVRGDDGDSR